LSPKARLLAALAVSAALVAGVEADVASLNLRSMADLIGRHGPRTDGAPRRVTETFKGGGDVFVSASAFWGSADDGRGQNANWFAESGTMYRRSGAGWTDSPVFRMWTRYTSLAFPSVYMDVRFNGWADATHGWHGVTLWLNRKLRTPDDGSRINDGPRQEGYTVDFVKRDGKIRIQKKVGDRYHILRQRRWQPRPGTWYRWGGRVIANRNGTSRIQVIVNGRVIQQVTDNGSVGGPPLRGGRVGLRGDYANVSIRNLSITGGGQRRRASRPAA